MVAIPRPVVRRLRCFHYRRHKRRDSTRRPRRAEPRSAQSYSIRVDSAEAPEGGPFVLVSGIVKIFLAAALGQNYSGRPVFSQDSMTGMPKAADEISTCRRRATNSPQTPSWTP